MSQEKTRVDFNAPENLVEKADLVADILDTTRTRLLTDALREEIGDIIEEEEIRRRVKEAYYDGDLDFEEVRLVLGTEEAIRMRFLRESIDREPSEPVTEDGLPTQEEFYEGEVPKWEPEEEKDN